MNVSCPCLDQPLANAVMPTGFCAFSFPIVIDRPRSVLALPGGSDLLALERGTESVVLLQDTDDDGVPDARRTVATASSLNHGMAVNDGYLYASSDTTVYRWPWDGESFTGSEQIVINNVNADGNGGAPQGHKTRTLEFDSLGWFYVSVGSDENVDLNSFRSRIRRFDMTNATLPIDFLTGEVFADGIRNAVAMAHDKHGVLWAADTGADNLQREDLGGNITNDNPAEELLRIPEEGLNFGYPFCFTEYRLDEPYGLGRGTAWAWPSFLAAGNMTDEDCRTVYSQADVAMQAHSTPLGIAFYNYKPPEELPAYCTGGAFPESMDGFVCKLFICAVSVIRILSPDNAHCSCF
jgi:glucose/arabinose dehydrogenase